MIGFFREHIKKRFTRSSHWPAIRKLHLKKQPQCQVCGRKWNRQVHHILPVHVRPDLELDDDNLITLCGRCHLLFGHLNNWKKWNDEIISDVKTWRTKIGR